MIRPSLFRRAVLAASLAVAVLAVGAVGRAAATPDIVPPTGNANFDYQIGDAYAPPDGVRVVSRDRDASPATGLYNICYVNAYQTQPAEFTWWQDKHDDLLLRDADGDYVDDGEWNETLLDTSTDAKRDALAAIVDGWTDGCAADGFDAVEPDNLDSWTRSGDLLSQADNLAYAKLLTGHAHDKGLAIAQKNTAEISDIGPGTGFDFAIAEECVEYDNECADYTAAYGNHVFVIEYDRSNFTLACRDWGDRLSVVLRDKLVTAPGSGTYVRDAC